jgi:hypothetical protein
MKRVKARKDAAVNVSDVLALGDFNRKGAFTHTASSLSTSSSVRFARTSKSMSFA